MSHLLSDNLKSSILSFLEIEKLGELYISYNWGRDNHISGFPDILALEKSICDSSKRNQISKNDILAIVDWGKLPNKSRIICPEFISLPIYQDGIPEKATINSPSFLIKKLQVETKGLGPTYLSKILRFMLPKYFGALDTRLVRVFGEGDERSKDQNWLKIRTRESDKNRWYIPKVQSLWPEEYDTWTFILRFVCEHLNNCKIKCPHPKSYLTNDLREENIWYCADVEMALFAFASSRLVK